MVGKKKKEKQWSFCGYPVGDTSRYPGYEGSHYRQSISLLSISHTWYFISSWSKEGEGALCPLMTIVLQGRRVKWTKGRLAGFTRGTTDSIRRFRVPPVLVFIAGRRTLPASRHMNIIIGCFMGLQPDAVTNRFGPPPRCKHFAKFPCDDINKGDTDTVATLSSPPNPVPSSCRVSDDPSPGREEIGHARIEMKLRFLFVRTVCRAFPVNVKKSARFIS